MNLHYNWTLKDVNFTKDKGKVFSCFAGGGGSSMGYKLAGFDVVGCNEIDHAMNAVYVSNLKPKYNFTEGIQVFKNKDDLPEGLFNLDILDGSPPCSSFSLAGNRSMDWGKEKKFREGQEKQILDTLFFDFIDLAERLQPKVVVAENVKGIIQGKAKKYVVDIHKSFLKAGYYSQHFLLDTSTMGVPQKRERIFFIALRNDLASQFLEQTDLFNIRPKLDLSYNKYLIPFSEIADELGDKLTDTAYRAWLHRDDSDIKLAQSKERAGMHVSDFNCYYAKKDKVLGMLRTKKHGLINYDIPQYVSKTTSVKAATFPTDYNFAESNPHYILGMSVPPLMVARIANSVYNQWLSKLGDVK